ncbi:MAG: hypothetical protein ACR2HJ_04000 [Fimbriimonadales bacterium]
MKIRQTLISYLIAAVLTIITLGPALAYDRDKGKGQGKSSSKQSRSKSSVKGNVKQSRGKATATNSSKRWRGSSQNKSRRVVTNDIRRRSAKSGAKNRVPVDARSYSKQHWNPAPPKKNGRHDNRDWNKKNREWRRLSDGTRYQYDGRYYYYNNNRFDSLSQLSRRRQQTKNEWRNIAYAGGAVALLGALKKDTRIIFAGSAGSLYALGRYEQDRKSQSKIDRLRSSYFDRDYIYRDGRRYDRRIVRKNGERYYQFVRR